MTDPKWAAALDWQVELSLQDEDSVEASLALALKFGTAVVFVGNPVQKVGFRVEHCFWLLAILEPGGIESSIGPGIWDVPQALIRKARLAQDHAGYPLYRDRETLKEFGRPSFSEADARKAARAIIAA